METLKVIKAREQADSCWKNFKEKILTKKSARDNVLCNSDFNSLLQVLISENNERTRKIALDFMAKCINSNMVSPVAFLTLIQQKLPQKSACKNASIPVIERVSRIILEIERATGIDFSFRLAASDPRTIPFLTEKLASKPTFDISSDFVNFLLGDPDLIVTSSIFCDSHYKMSRCRILFHILNEIEKEECAELLMTFLIWNSARPCILELESLSGLVLFFLKSASLSVVHLELLQVYLEVIGNVFLKYGCFSETIELICDLPPSFLSDISAFKIGSLLLLSNNLNYNLVTSILKLLMRYDNLNTFSLICCAKVMMISEVDDELAGIMKGVYSKGSHGFRVSVETLTQPIVDFGIVTHLGLLGQNPNSSEHESYFQLLELVRNFENISEIKFNKIIKKGYFEMLFSLLAFKWATEDRTVVLKGFLNLLGNVENEDPEAKLIRYSWVVDFFETNFDFQFYLDNLPIICEFVTSSDNILFALVQQKISQFLAQKDNVSVQLPTILSLLVLFESSQSRQSRLNFLTSSTLSYLHSLVSNNLSGIDSRALIISFKLLEKLCEISVIDPRDIWSKYIDKLISFEELFSNAHVRGAIFSFASALRLVPDGSEGEINQVKKIGVELLLEYLPNEYEFFALDQICDSLSKFDIETLRKVEFSILNPVSREEDNEDTIKSVSIDEVLSKSNIFNPPLLFEISKRFSESPSSNYTRLWACLIDNEIQTMPRTKFLGSNEQSQSSKKSEIKTKAIINPSFCNGLIFEIFSGSDFSTIESVIKCIKIQLIPLVPSVNTVLWYVRPHLPGYLLDATGKIFNSIDDQRIKKQLCNYEFLLTNLKSGSSPYNLSTLLLVVSSIMKVAFMNQIISENFLFNNWIAILTEKLSGIPEFKLILGNDEFLSAVAISCNILSGCSIEIDKLLCSALEKMIIDNPKVRDGVSVYCAIEALSKVCVSKIQVHLIDKSVSNKRKLVALIACLRMNLKPNVELSEKVDELSKIILVIASKSDSTETFVDPLEFKNLSLYAQSFLPRGRDNLREKSQQRAFDCGNVPSSLKYDAILSYLLGSNLDFLNMKLMDSQNVNISSLEGSTKDPKSLALLQFISRSVETESVGASSSGLDRFDRLSWLKFIGSQSGNFKYKVLINCKLLPRIDWGHVEYGQFDFVLKHIVSITPITNVPFINPSLLTSFLENVVKSIKTGRTDSKSIEKIIQVLNNNSDEKSVKILEELMNFAIIEDGDLLELLLLESLKFPPNLLKTFNFEKFYQLKPEIIVKYYSILSKLFEQFNFKDPKLCCLSELKDGKNVFSTLQSILDDAEDFKMKCLSLKIQEFKGKFKIKAVIDVIDLMFIKREEEDKFNILSGLLSEILEDIDFIIFESRRDLCEPEMIEKLRSRSSLLPKDICDRLENLFTLSEFDREAF